MTKKCVFCNKKLSHNNKIGFCLSCIPEKKILNLFKNGKTITEISSFIFKSTSGNYREFIRNILRKNLGPEFTEMRKKNKANFMFNNSLDKLPILKFIKNYKKGYFV